MQPGQESEELGLNKVQKGVYSVQEQVDNG